MNAITLCWNALLKAINTDGQNSCETCIPAGHNLKQNTNKMFCKKPQDLLSAACNSICENTKAE